ncbi:MAG TPA: hypothetical protein VF823_12335, partial [Anaerolineales bacterium]
MNHKNSHQPHRNGLRRLAILLSVMVMLSLASATVLSASAAPEVGSIVWIRQRVDAPQLFFNMTDRSLRFDSNGNPRIAYGGDHLYYANYDGTKWNLTTVDGAFGTGQYASLAVNRASGNTPYISYYDSLSQSLKFATLAGSSWQVQTIDSPSNVQAQAEASAPEDVHPSILEKLPAAPGTPSSLQAITRGVGLYTSIALDSTGKPHIAYLDAINGDLRYASWTGSVWNLETLRDGNNKQKAIFISLAIDSNDNPNIAYYDDKYDHLTLASFDGRNWSYSQVDGTTFAGVYASLALDKNDKPHISYYDANTGDLKYATLGNSGWSNAKVDTSGDVGGFTSITLDSNARPWISYYDFTTHSLKYARYNGTSWSSGKLTDGDSSGLYTSIATNKTDGEIAISYYQATTGDLHYAWWDGSKWKIQSGTVDISQDVGQAASLALNKTSGLP